MYLKFVYVYHHKLFCNLATLEILPLASVVLFDPIEEIGNNFSKFLDKYPVTPYLESRQSLVRWTNFIHNKINTALNMPTLTLEEALSSYYEHYKPKEIKDNQERKRREKIAFAVFVAVILAAAIYLYRK